MSNKLLMPFIDESESFVHGFECGQIWEKMSEGQQLIAYLFHSENIDQVHLICEHFKCEYVISPFDETWSYLTATH